MTMMTVSIGDHTAHFVHSDLDLHCQQKLHLSSSVRKELILSCANVAMMEDPEISSSGNWLDCKSRRRRSFCDQLCKII